MALLKPTGDHVLVRLDKMEETFGDSVLVRPDVAKDKPKWGEVVAAGPGRYTKKNVLVPMSLLVGDRVCVEWRTGHDLTIGGRDHVMVREPDILAVDRCE